MDMWTVDLAVGAGFLIGVVVKGVIDLRAEHQRRREVAVSRDRRRGGRDGAR